jgi:TctA family transporter
MRKNDPITQLQLERIKLKAELKETETRLATNLKFVKENAVWLIARGLMNSPKMQESIKRELSNFALGFVQGIIPGWLAAEGAGTAKKWAAKAFTWITEKFGEGKSTSEENE